MARCVDVVFFSLSFVGLIACEIPNVSNLDFLNNIITSGGLEVASISITALMRKRGSSLVSVLNWYI
jgi:hypothetical protein